VTAQATAMESGPDTWPDSDASESGTSAEPAGNATTSTVTTVTVVTDPWRRSRAQPAYLPAIDSGDLAWFSR
jgi:hypothetical protein